MNLLALPGAPRPSLDRTATNHSRSPGGAPTIRNRENPHLTPGFLGFRLDKKHGSYRRINVITTRQDNVTPYTDSLLQIGSHRTETCFDTFG